MAEPQTRGRRGVSDAVATRPTRRSILRWGALGPFAATSLSAALGACSGGSRGTGGMARKGGVGVADSTLPAAKRLHVSSWVGYIDPDRTLVADFSAATGLSVQYDEDYNDNNEYFARIQPVISQGKSIGRDLIVPSSWMGGRMIQLGWLKTIPIGLRNLTNITPAAARLVEAFDRQTEYLLPWATGMTGIGYNRKITGGDLHSINDLFDPRFKGKVTMLTEMRDTIGLTLLSLGKNPVTTDFHNAADAFARLEKAKADGQIRAFTGNDYVDDLDSGNVAACLAYSGDVLQLQRENPDVRFLIPDEGVVYWGDTMAIPSTAANVEGAGKWMDFFYDPKIAARLTAAIQYTSPVQGCREALVALGGDAAKLAESEVLFPGDDVVKRLYPYRNYPEDDETLFDEAFARLTGS